MNKPTWVPFADLPANLPEQTGIWAVPTVRDRVRAVFPFPLLAMGQRFAGQRALLVVGGGTLIDEAKVWRHEQAPDLELVAIPSLWGSGAEVSPIAVLEREGKKVFRKDARLLPDRYSFWPELASTIPLHLAQYGCGDCWAHAFEGFFSPLASSELRQEIAGLIHEMLELDDFQSPLWFEWSARACAAQARSSVGLVHGIAHQLEPILKVRQPESPWGHARLCTLFLWPVLAFNGQQSTKGEQLLLDHHLSLAGVQEVARRMFEKADYQRVLSVLVECWSAILRDPCTRTNSVLVRPAALDFFRQGAFP